MARTSWATIKLCLPSWLAESAPHKQAFVLFLVMLSPSLFLSPFLLSPLSTLLLLSSATVAGALSAWMTMKVTRTILAHSSPLPPTPISCVKSLVHIMSLKIINPVFIADKFPWLWLWFNNILASSYLRKIEDRSNRTVMDAVEKPAGEVSYSSDDVSSETLNEKAGDLRFQASTASVGEVLNVVRLMGKPSSDREILEEVKAASEEGREKFSMLEFGRGGLGSVYFRGAVSGAKGFRPKKSQISAGLSVHGTDTSLSHTKNGSDSDNVGKSKLLESALSERGGGERGMKKEKILEGEAKMDIDIVQKHDQSSFDGQSLSRIALFESNSRKNIGEIIKKKPVESSDKTIIKGCASHSWCQRGVDLEEEMVFLMEDIHKLCLGKWYPNLSTDESFPAELKMLLDICLKQAAYLGSKCDVLSLAGKLGSLFLCHLREFRKARRKKRAAETMTNTTIEDELRKSEQSVHVEKVTLEEIRSKKIDNSIHSTMAGLLQTKDFAKVKEQDDHILSEEGAVLAEQKGDDVHSPSQPVTPYSVTSPQRSCISSVSAKCKVLVESGVGEEAYYRFRFGQSRGTKDLPRNYLLNISNYIVKNIIDKVGKLPSCPLEHYFSESDASLADTPPGKVLTSLVARKIILPLIETVSDPNWLNLRIANLLVEHARAKLYLDSDGSKENFPFVTGGVHQVVCESNSKDLSKSEGECLLNAPIVNERDENLSEVSKDLSSQDERRKSLSLPLEISSSSTVVNPIDGRISTVLGGIISATAAPLLPDNAKVSYKPIKRMWSSPSIEEGKELDGEPELKKKMRPFGRNIVDGLPVENDETLAAAAQDVLCATGSEEIARMHSLSSSKETRNSHRKARLSLSARIPHHKKFLGLPFGTVESPGASSQGILFRSKSIHNIQNGKDGALHIEEGSELHEDVCLSDEPVSPVMQEKESWEHLDWKPNRSRSFHGVKSYHRHREETKLEKAERVRKKMGSEVPEKDTNEQDGLMPRVSSEGSMREHNSKSLEESKAELKEGLGARWMKYALGKWDTQWTSEGDSDEINRIGSNSLHSSTEKGEKESALSSGTSLSEGYNTPDLFKLENKFWSNNDSFGKVVIEERDGREVRHGSDSEEKKEATIYHSSPIPAAAGEDSSQEIPKDISPVYEEVEDLPSTIAKLKAFLKERNGKMGETTPPPSDEVKKEGEFFPISDSSMDQEASQPQKPPSPHEERPFSWPSDGGIFLNVRIPYTEICKGTSASQMSSTSPHVLYCIEYDAAYPEEGADAAAASSVVGEQSVDEGFTSHSSDKEHKDYISNSENAEMVPPSPGTTIHHVLVKRTFQEFLDLHAQLEADPLWRQALKGLKGPSRWLSLPFGKTSASTVAGRRTLLQAYLRGVCTSMPQLASSSLALRTFMAYQGVSSKPVVSGGTLPASVERILPLSVEGGEGPVPRIDKLFARTVSGMFNTLKTALPGFDSPETTQAASVTQASTSTSPNPPSQSSSHFDSSSAPATLNESKGSSGNPGTIRGTTIQLPAFLQFGNSNTSRHPDLVDWDMEYGEKDTEGNVTAPGSVEGLPVKNYSLEEDIQTFLNMLVNSMETKTDAAEFAYEALHPSTMYGDGEDVGDQRLPSCLHRVLERQYTVDSADEDGEEEELDAFLPLAKVTIDILCEALRGTGSWVSQGTVVHASKVIIGSYIENKLQEFLGTVTTKEMWCQYIHILRIAVFHHGPDSWETDISSKEIGSSYISEQQLAVAIYTAFPELFRQIVGNRELLEAAKFMADSLQNRVILKDLVLQVLHVCIVHLVPGLSLLKELN